jgi:hypothetical protein
MANSPAESSLLALAALLNFPPAIRESIISDHVFAHTYGLKADALISFNDGQVSIQRSELFGSIRKILADNNAQPILKDAAGEEWRLEFFELNNARRLALLQEKRRFVLADFSPLSPDQGERITGLDHVAHNIHLPQETISLWHEILAARALTDDEMIEFHRDVENTPIRLAAVIGSETKKGEITFWSMVPRSEEYFLRLVGKCETGQNIEEFTPVGPARHIRELMSWRPYDGLLFSLLLSSHSSISSAIDLDQIEERDLVRAYEWLQNNGDRISQLGAIEIGLSVWDKYQNIHPYVQNMVDQIRDDNADDEKSRFQLLSALIMLVDGEIARTRILREKPPFWRRLASIAQASLIERHIKSQVDIAEFSKWSFKTRGQLFYLQTMVDLRREPRWHPDYVSSHQLKAEFIGRIHNAARQNATKIQNNTLREALIGDGPESLQRLVVFPQTFLPGPLEGGLIAQIEPPTDILTEIEKQLSQDVLEPKSFIALMNSALVFRLDLQQARLAAKAMRAAKYHLSRMNNTDLVSILRGLATVAAVTRSDELAQELRILTRKYRQQPGDNLSAENALWIGLIAAASHSELKDWCMFVGDWITDLAFQSLQLDEMQRLHFHVEQMCHIVPDLWPTCGRADAALNSCDG